ncbi:RFX DNA-binding domain [Teratosphaeria destructans]|uniref:RFX DNA-binding domain n=1 Tax=Teratosphaeria destructans TaxID=418781 RepID=A0A9W7SRB0_9PEZI|nr:RFX DNA-binding domain [Teratosphaeria destructans]
MSAASQHNEGTQTFAPQLDCDGHDGTAAQLLQSFSAPAVQQQADMSGYTLIPQPQHMPPQDGQNTQYHMPNMFPQDQQQHQQQYMQQDAGYGSHVRMGSVPVHSGAEMGDDKKRKGSAVTATNDRELREMLAKNEGRPLREVAQEVIQKERTPMAEKTKQLFAMLWLRAVCKPAKTSVPRNRVYSQYANRCGTERVIPLNPASFGKLVRVIFPGIQTRRLGVRGESKYHYVDLALDDESLNPITNPSFNAYQVDHRPHRSESVGTHIDFNNIPRLQADASAFPSADGGYDPHAAFSNSSKATASQARAFAYPDTRGMQPGSTEALSYSHNLRFPNNPIPEFSESETVILPSIHPYLPPRTDIDTADALCALYRTHCTSLIDSIRFCKEKQFFRLYTSFHGTLTVPVQKLFTNPNLAPWIEQCDLVMYRTMVRFVSRLTLQAAPAVVINILSNISGNLHGHIAKTFASQPAHVLDAKLKPATVFAGLLYRLIRVNQSAHAAANLLTIDQNREQMWREWSTMVNPKRVMEAELPDCGFEEVYKILTSEMRSLLEPLKAPAFDQDPYGLGAYNFDEQTNNAGFAQFLQSQTVQSGQDAATSAVSTENVLDRWASFLTALPGRFPQATARTVLHCISGIGTAALRDITIMNGLSYGHWWVLKIFVDEMALWMAEMGGFLEPTYPAALSNGNAYHSPALPNGIERSQSASRMSGSPALSGNGPFMSGPNGQAAAPQQQQQQQHHQTYMQQAHQNMNQQQHLPQQTTFSFQAQQAQMVPSKSQQQQQQQGNDTDIDDSGIGMSLMEEEMTMNKFRVSNGHMSMTGIGGAEMRVDAL